MLGTAILRLVDFCTRQALWVVVAAAIVAGSCGIYAVRHFAVNTDPTALFPPNLPWARQAFQYMRAFPEPGIVVVVEAPTPEDTEQAVTKLAAALTQRKDNIKTVYQPQGGALFEHNGLLYLPTGEVARLTSGLSQASPLIATLTADPSLRGSLGALSDALAGVEAGMLPLDALTRPVDMASDAVLAALADRPANFSWQALASGHPPAPAQLRRFIEVEPFLDYRALEPGRRATDVIAQTAQQLQLGRDYQASVRLTGLVPINDDGFATLTKNAGLNAAISLSAVALVLWVALRWLRIILPVAMTIIAGLAVSAAFGLFFVGALNLISVAFLVLFIGLGIDFGIQFSVRYRAERHELGSLRPALRSAARKSGPPLALAAAATAVGFGCFVPTDYRGLSELGEIAGAGMVIAFLGSVTLLPALLAILHPLGERRPMGLAALAPVDRFLGRHRIAIVAVTLGIVAAASPLLAWLRFDFNPLHLHDPTAPSVATYLELRKEPQIGANAAEAVAPNLDAANALARRLSGLPQVSRVSTLDSLIPADQRTKLALIARAAAAIGPALHPQHLVPPPNDRENVAALNATAKILLQATTNHNGSAADAAKRLAGLLTELAKAPAAARGRAEAAVAGPLRVSLNDLRQALTPQRITLDAIPPDLKRQWVAPDGTARVQALPKGDPDNTAVLRHFVAAVLAIAPNATGPAVLLFEAGNTVVHAIIEAGIFAICAIVLLLAATLRRARDVLLTLVPLLVAGVVTLELAVVLGLRLNFANIIALPLLLGVGVAFKIYYMLAWRAGRTALVQSSLTRAVIFSAMTTATAFGSLWMSSDPGTSSMGEFMALALVSTMAAAVLFQPALMGPPRQQEWTGTRQPQPEPAIIVQRAAPAKEAARQAPSTNREDRPAEHELER
jgi:hopanoid biosynthesis associated RND transporter like protein HpnN